MTYLMRKSCCPHCGAPLDRADPADRHTTAPAPGDSTVCLLCAGLCKFGPDLRLLAMTQDDLEEMDADALWDLMRARRIVLRINERFTPENLGSS